MMGRPVAIPAKPARIVSINPTATEMLYIAGGTTVARGSSSAFPSEVLDLPELGGAYSPSFEAIAAQRADLILIEALSQARFPEPLMQFGAPVVAVRATSLDDITTGIKLMGQIIEAAALGNAASNTQLGSVCLWRTLFRWWDASSFPDATSKRNQPGKAGRTAQHRAMPSTPPNFPVPDNSCG